jgi:hypothetical protein
LPATPYGHFTWRYIKIGLIQVAPLRRGVAHHCALALE